MNVTDRNQINRTFKAMMQAEAENDGEKARLYARTLILMLRSVDILPVRGE